MSINTEMKRFDQKLRYINFLRENKEETQEDLEQKLKEKNALTLKDPNRFRKRFRRAREIARITALVGALTFGAAEYVNVKVSNIVLPHYETSITEMYNPSLNKAEAHQATVLFAGLGQKKADDYAKDLMPALQERFNDEVLSVQYSSDGVDIKGIAQKLLQKMSEDNINEFNGVGISSGGIFMPEVFGEMNAERVAMNKDPIPFGTITLAGSPITPEDIKNGNYIIPVWLNKMHAGKYAGLGGKNIFEDYTYVFSNFFSHKGKLRHQFKLALNHTFDDMTPSLWFSQLDIDAQSSVPKVAKELSKINAKHVEYLASEDPTRDQTVNEPSAIAHLNEAQFDVTFLNKGGVSGKFGAGAVSPMQMNEVIVLKVPHAGHVTIGQQKAEYNKVLIAQWKKEEQATASTTS